MTAACGTVGDINRDYGGEEMSPEWDRWGWTHFYTDEKKWEIGRERNATLEWDMNAAVFIFLADIAL